MTDKNNICRLVLTLLESGEVDLEFDWETGKESDVGQFLFRLHTGQMKDPMTEEMIEVTENEDSTEEIVDYMDGLYELRDAFNKVLSTEEGPVISPTKVFQQTMGLRDEG